jgi:peptidyl-tRNA hydrolase, PTH1 family
VYTRLLSRIDIHIIFAHILTMDDQEKQHIFIYGLGNNAPEYLNTRHNAGRIIIEIFNRNNQLQPDKKKSLYISQYQEFTCAYGNGFMNTSGSQLNEYIQFKKPQIKQLIVIQDDSDQKSGSIKLVKGGGHAGHKGIQDIYNHCLNWNISPTDIWRIKVGIRPDQNVLRSETFVLKTFAPAEIADIQSFAKDLWHQLSQESNTTFNTLQFFVNSYTMGKSSIQKITTQNTPLTAKK